jgi:hypothetical protein
MKGTSLTTPKHLVKWPGMCISNKQTADFLTSVILNVYCYLLNRTSQTVLWCSKEHFYVMCDILMDVQPRLVSVLGLESTYEGESVNTSQMV